ncbi:ORF C287, putative [Babesia ovata]|uniref:ORF C287, putative n=1 Tax=Babesia ovata TaxID=189622 RepID=A0A2H6KHN0_9APIC|nr:ORF C287, putative [Babesia ovata]GBE62498.1 ORF C287, putative [Babesia ovata]
MARRVEERHPAINILAMFSGLRDDEEIRRQLETSLGLDSAVTTNTGDDVQEELEALEGESDQRQRRRVGVGFQAAKKVRVFSAEESKLKEVIKGKQSASKSKRIKTAVKQAAIPEDDDDAEPSRLDLILSASSNLKAERRKLRAKRLGKA